MCLILNPVGEAQVFVQLFVPNTMLCNLYMSCMYEQSVLLIAETQHLATCSSRNMNTHKQVIVIAKHGGHTWWLASIWEMDSKVCY